MAYEQFNDKEHANPFGESLPEQIAKHILKKIMQGEYIPGDKIAEEHIASELNTSRAPVREALYLLQVDNIVERIPRKGVIVKTFTESEIKEYAEVMIGLIQMAIELTKESWTKDKIAILDNKVQQMQVDYGQQDLMAYQSSSAHVTEYLFEVANNRPLSHFYKESVYILKVFANLKWTVETMEHFHSQMTRIVELLKANQLDKAKALVPHLLLDTLD
ncbi:GntR family transcriptional regulator [Gracilibacillus saliphilus]|uniref:GntR family transcriptional regulator n=1 Tax=Gracilibacillus saliphilus TaxID=543890 RepID=UPI0013D5F06A|nr:GntR family transcriptional regulator [Gracilibacillus saliphilus]